MIPFSRKPIPQAAPRAKDRLSMLRDQMDAEQAITGGASRGMPRQHRGPMGARAPAPIPSAVAGKPMVTGTVTGGLQKGPTKQPTPTTTVNPNAPSGTQGTGGNGPDGSGNAAPPGSVYTPPPPTQKTIDQEEEDFIRSLMEQAGHVDTSEEEKAIRDTQERLMGQGLVNARARGGAAGFAMSGQQLAAEGGVRADAASKESQQIIDARNKAKQQAIDNALGGANADIALRQAADDHDLLELYLSILSGDPPPAEDSGGGGGGGDGIGAAIGDLSGISSGTSLFGKDTDQSQLPSAGDNPAATTTNPTTSYVTEQAPRSPNDKLVSTADGYNYYEDSTNHTFYRVKA